MDENGNSPASREIARQLLAYEVEARGSSSASVPATVRVCDKLRHPLSTLMGLPAFRSLLGRALTLAKREAGNLGAVNVKEDGSLEGLNGDPDQAGLPIVASLLELLETFIGQTLTMRFLYDIWPTLAEDDSSSMGRDQ
jgi:hypothetical protein